MKNRFFGIIERTFELSTLYSVSAQIPNFITYTLHTFIASDMLQL